MHVAYVKLSIELGEPAFGKGFPEAHKTTFWKFEFWTRKAPNVSLETEEI